MSRIAVFAGWRLAPIFTVVDLDAGTSEPTQTNVVELTPAQWQEFKDGGDEAVIAEVRAQLEAQIATVTTPNRAARRANGRKAKSAI